jgi:hypothetical protein
VAEGVGEGDDVARGVGDRGKGDGVGRGVGDRGKGDEEGRAVGDGEEGKRGVGDRGVNVTITGTAEAMAVGEGLRVAGVLQAAMQRSSKKIVKISHGWETDNENRDFCVCSMQKSLFSQIFPPSRWEGGIGGMGNDVPPPTATCRARASWSGASPRDKKAW